MKLPDYINPNCTHWKSSSPCIYQRSTDTTGCLECPKVSPISDQTPTDIGGRLDFRSIAKNIGSTAIIEAGGLGSVLRTTAVSKAINSINPEIDIALVTHKRGVNLAKYIPEIAYAIELDTSDFEENYFDYTINFEHDTRCVPILNRSRIIAGFAINSCGKFYPANQNSLYLQRIHIDDNFRKKNKLTMQQVLLQTAGIYDDHPSYSLKINTYSRATNTFFKTQTGYTIPDNFISINTGTSERGKVKRWPTNNIIKLSQKLSADGITSVLLCGPDEQNLKEELSGAISNNIHLISFTDDDLEHFLRIIKLSKLVVSGDTFGAHAAFALNTPTIILNGPAPYRELEVVGDRDIAIGPFLDCWPCFYRCPLTDKGMCMNMISVDMVYNSVIAHYTH